MRQVGPETQQRGKACAKGLYPPGRVSYSNSKKDVTSARESHALMGIIFRNTFSIIENGYFSK